MPANNTPPTENRLVTRLLAFVVIAIGIGLVVYVFVTAKALFEAPTPPLPSPAPTPKPLPGAMPAPDNTPGIIAIQAGYGLANFMVRKLLSLLVMCVAGSLIAALGIRWWGKR